MKADENNAIIFGLTPRNDQLNKKKKVNEILIGEYSKSNINFIKHDNLYARRH